jgi:succinoglycan biosynthesis protein ExoA
MVTLAIIVPVLNERQFIEKCFESIVHQDFGNIVWRLIVCDGGSTDGTRDIIQQYCAQYENIEFCYNPKKFQVYALNLMIGIADSDFIIRCDCHAEYENGYFTNLVNFLTNHPEAGNVGSQVTTKPGGSNFVAQAISAGLGSKFGVGSSHRTRFSSNPIDVDTVLFGAWRKDIFLQAGLFDEDFIRGQDLEHNIRIIKSGLRVVQIPGPKLVYYTRSRFIDLFKMMMQYASVKPLIFKKHRLLPNVRSLIPVSFYLFLFLVFFIDSYISVFIFSLYLLVLVSGSVFEFLKPRDELLPFPVALILPIVFFVQHAAHAYGFIYGTIKSLMGNTIYWNSSRF